ncbi:Protein FAM188A-like protein [Diplonema papillatum]|nr:Protein FAM188A-like protein [Diplonema papillatum]
MPEAKEKKKKAAKPSNSAALFAADEGTQADESSKALLREFMHSKGLTDTLRTFDDEQPRGDLTIASRALMSDLLALHGFQERNKAKPTPRNTLLEVVCDDRLLRREKALATQNPQAPLEPDSDDPDAVGPRLAVLQEDRTRLTAELTNRLAQLTQAVEQRRCLEDELASMRAAGRKKKEKLEKLEKKLEKKAEKKQGKSKRAKSDGGKLSMTIDQLLDASAKSHGTNGNGRKRGGGTAKEEKEAFLKGLSSLKAPPADKKPRKAKKGGSIPPQEVATPSAAEEEASSASSSSSPKAGGSPGSETDSSGESFSKQLRAADSKYKQQQQQLLQKAAGPGGAKKGANWSAGLLDVDDEHLDHGSPALSHGASIRNALLTPTEPSATFDPLNGSTVQGRPIDSNTAKKLKKLICGAINVPETWLQQGFSFTAEPSVKYGLVQNSGGPCGVLAVVQARVVKQLFLVQGLASTEAITPDAQREAITAALAETLLTVAAGGSVQLATPPDFDVQGRRQLKYSVDFESWRTQTIGRSPAAVASFFRENYDFYKEPCGLGLLSLVCSAVLTRGGADAVVGDMDASISGTDDSLIVRHNYSSQELVSLLLYGKAHSNVFNGMKRLGDQNEHVALQGTPAECELGLLSYRDHLKDIEVGSYLKSPLLPVWVVWNESHYSVVFAKERIDHSAARAELFYYDQYACQNEEYRLTVDASDPDAFVEADDDDTPYMDSILRTREPWKRAKVDWNGSEGLLPG